MCNVVETTRQPFTPRCGTSPYLSSKPMLAAEGTLASLNARVSLPPESTSRGRGTDSSHIAIQIYDYSQIGASVMEEKPRSAEGGEGWGKRP